MSSLKVIIFIIVLILLIVLPGLFSFAYVVSSSNSIIDSINIIKTNINNNDWEAALENTNIMKNKWDKTSSMWYIFIESSMVDQIDMLIENIKYHVALHDDYTALNEISLLKYYITKIPENEKFSLNNILYFNLILQ